MELEIKSLIDRYLLPDDDRFLEIFTEACTQAETFTAVSTPIQRKIHYMTPTCYEMTGYPADQFMQGGYEFLFSVTAPESIPSLLHNIQSSFAQSTLSDYDPRSTVLHEFINDFIKPDGNRVTLLTTAIVLSYAATAYPENIISMISPDKPELRSACSALLTRLKERHNQIFEYPALKVADEPIRKVFVFKDEDQKLTPREKEILKLLAKGLTSQEIGKNLFIGENTVETHRKNLLAKFDAKNMAELIKKASKIYWLE